MKEEKFWIDIMKMRKVSHCLYYRCYLALIGAEVRERFEVAEIFDILNKLR